MIASLKNTWTYKHLHHLLTLAVFIVACILAFPFELLPKVEAVAYEATVEDQQTEAYINELEQRALVIYESRFNENMRTAMTIVLQEENDKLMKAAMELPNEDFSHLRQVITSLENN